MKPAHIRQAETMVQSLIVAFNELEKQQESLLSNNQRMTNLFLTLDEKLWNEIVRFKKPHAIHKELEVSAISLEKTLASTETLSWKDNLSLRHTRKPQSQHSDAMLGQKQKPEKGKQADLKGSRDSEWKKPQLKCYNCDKIGHIAKECCASKKEKDDYKSSGKDGGQWVGRCHCWLWYNWKSNTLPN